MRLFCAFVIVIGLSLNGYSQVTDLMKAFPEDNFIPGWTEDTVICRYGTANDTASLYLLIDGGAEVFLENKFKNAAAKGYANATDTVCAQLFDQTNNTGASGLFTSFDTLITSPEIVNLGVKTLIDTTLPTDFFLISHSGKYFLRANTYATKSAESKSFLIALAQSIIGKVPITTPTISPSVLRLSRIYASTGPEQTIFFLHGNLDNTVTQNSLILTIYNTAGKSLVSLPVTANTVVWEYSAKPAAGSYIVILSDGKTILRKDIFTTVK